MSPQKNNFFFQPEPSVEEQIPPHSSDLPATQEAEESAAQPPPPRSLRTAVREAVVSGNLENNLAKISSFLEKAASLLEKAEGAVCGFSDFIGLVRKNLTAPEEPSSQAPEAGVKPEALGNMTLKLLGNLIKTQEFQLLMANMIVRFLRETPGSVGNIPAAIGETPPPSPTKPIFADP